MASARPFAFHVMAKPIGPVCNLGCRYCFYLEKRDLYEGSRCWQMPDDVLETFVRGYIEAHEAPEVTFAWQGGEPTLLGVRFFRRVVELQERYACGKRIVNALQTNGTLLDDEWARFLRSADFLVGLSIDGPARLHDLHRVDHRGRPSHHSVLRGLEALQRHRVEYNTLTVVNADSGAEPLEVYRYLKSIGSRYLQFIPLVERRSPASTDAASGRPMALAGPPQSDPGDADVAPWSVGAGQFGQFLIAVFDEWIRRDVGRVFVQTFDVALGMWSGMGAALCVFAETCGEGLAIEHNGDVYACDHYVYPEFRRGNVVRDGLAAMVRSVEQQAFGAAKRDTLTDECRRCPVLFACGGDCPKHRFVPSSGGEPGQSYLCPSYLTLFQHIDPHMQAMCRLLKQGRAPAEIMAIIGRGERTAAPPGRNDACPCGSGRKYKACCLRLR